MEMSINGRMEPSSNNGSDDYTGHFLQVSYTRLIGGNSVFSKDRVDVAPDGGFRFFLPKSDQLYDQLIIIEVHAPDGEEIGRQRYTYGSLKAAATPPNADDNSGEFIIKIDPKVIEFNSESPAMTQELKYTGRVIDLSATKNVGGINVIIMVSMADDEYQPLFTAATDRDGYFFSSQQQESYEQAYGIVAGNANEPIPLHLDDEGQLPRNIILAADLSLSDLPEADSSSALPGSPDQIDLTTSSAFSQDLGGKCVDFTVPNRTLEEFSYYHTVRTTEPEIKGQTLNAKESVRIKNELSTISDGALSILSKINQSFRSLSLIPVDIREDADITDAPPVSHRRIEATEEDALPIEHSSFKVYVGGIKLNTADLSNIIGIHSNFDIIRTFTEQMKKVAKLRQLHYKLTAAYCGLHGVEEALHYCQSLDSFELLDMEHVQSLAANVKKHANVIEDNVQAKKLLSSILASIDSMADLVRPGAKEINALEQNIKELVNKTNRHNARGVEPLLEQLRLILKEINIAKEHPLYNFQACPPDDQPDNMGIICVIKEYKKIKEKLRHKAVLELDEIIEIRGYYDIFVSSITAFLDLLDEFYRFYKSILIPVLSLDDSYFVDNYDEIKRQLSGLKRSLYAAIKNIEAHEREYIHNHPGRKNLTVETEVDWDETPTIYHNTTIAHGHILHFKQKWKANGYSLGDLLYSLPLAPCQEKQIAILDWDREESAGRTEETAVEESLTATISRDRDVSEVVNSAFSEHINASSTNKTKSTSAGIGGAVGGIFPGGVFGAAGGISHSGASSTSTSTQDASRNLSANSLHQLQDNVSQAASSLRSQRSTVVQTVSQGENLNIQTEVIKNNNHCHSMTVEYFEVLRHFTIEQELADVQECLFIPLPMTPFDDDKILRWKNSLRSRIYGRKLLRGFDALERIRDNYINSNFPDSIYADEPIKDISGHFTISFDFERPPIPEIDEAVTEEDVYVEVLLSTFFWITRITALRIARRLIPLSDEEKDELFQKEYAHELAREFVDNMELIAVTDTGERSLRLDLSLISRYSRNTQLRVNIARTQRTPELRRSDIKSIIFRSRTEVHSMSRIILHSAHLQYRTAYTGDHIIRNARLNNDIINQDSALVYTPLSSSELRNPRKEDAEAADALREFLNEYIELSHKVIWSHMDRSRLFGLLDGYIAPNSGGKSVASVVENRIMGIVGNNLVLKVVPGERLDPVFRGVENLLDYYRPTTPPDPFRISMPTKGVYAEAVMGKCNSCEVIDETRHWRFEDVPCGTKPTPIATVGTDSRRAEPGNLQAKDLPTSIINMQNAPAAPDPTGLASLYGLMGKGDSFKDYTGLVGTQANALSALQTTSKSVTDLANISKDMANMGLMANSKVDGPKQIEQIKKLKNDGYFTHEEAKKEIQKVLDNYNNAAKSISKAGTTDGKDSVAKKLTEHTVNSESDSNPVDIKYSQSNPDGSQESIEISKQSSTSDAQSSESRDEQADEDIDDAEIGDHSELHDINSDMRDNGGSQ